MARQRVRLASRWNRGGAPSVYDCDDEPAHAARTRRGLCIDLDDPIDRRRLKRIQYRTDLLDGFLAHTGLNLEPDSTRPLKICNRGFGFDAEPAILASE